jgi:7,8-didemethyl-8-hydroxy-5-deazariboflavin synthase CofG subunit
MTSTLTFHPTTALRARGEELRALMRRAAVVRDEGLARAGRPGTITWSRKVFIPVTTLCRDRCHYCTFVDTPGKLATKGLPPYLDEDQVLAIAHQGARAGCREALLTLGDRPEDRWPIARQWLDGHGFASTIDYIGHLARRITAETGLLAHLNPGVMTHDELERLRPTAPSMGMMLETTSRRLFETPGEAHFGSPDKDPAVRLKTLEDAGTLRIPFTTGLLVGIGETTEELAEGILALKHLSDRHGHLQEVIVQNFRAKPATAMQGAPDADTESYLAAIATARLVMGPDARIQAPPNLSDPAELSLLIEAGIDDWGGVSPLTADHVNPERPWPQVTELERLTAAQGYALRERLTAHPRYIADRSTWIDPALHDAVLRLADGDHLADPAAAPVAARPEAAEGHTTGRSVPVHIGARPDTEPVSLPGTDSRSLLDRAENGPGELDREDVTRLLELDGADLDRLTGIAEDLRRSVVGSTATLVVNRNLDSSRITDPAVAAAVAADAWDLGATELCIQGTAPADAPADVYEQLARAVKAAAPQIHLHAFRPADVVDGAHRMGRTLTDQLTALQDAGVDTVPGTGVKILDERIRRGSFPGDLPVEDWIASITEAHALGLRSTSVMFYGHGETAADRAGHLMTLRALQERTGGFTELVPMPMPDATERDHRAVHAVSRIAMHGAIPHIQAAWTRLGPEGALLALRSGADDFGGVLLDGRVVPEAGVEHGQELTVPAAQRMARTLGRHLRLRTTTYGIAPSSGL